MTATAEALVSAVQLSIHHEPSTSGSGAYTNETPLRAPLVNCKKRLTTEGVHEKALSQGSGFEFSDVESESDQLGLYYCYSYTYC